MVAIRAAYRQEIARIRREVFRIGLIDKERDRPRHQLLPMSRGWLSGKNLAAGLEEEFFLDSPFHRTFHAHRGLMVFEN